MDLLELLREFLKCGKLFDDESLAGKIDQAFGAKLIEGGGYSLPGGTDEKGYFLVREMHLDGHNPAFHLAKLFSVPDKEGGYAFADILEDHFGDTFLESSQAEADSLRDLKIQFRLHLEKGLENFILQRKDNRIDQRLGKFPACVAGPGKR